MVNSDVKICNIGLSRIGITKHIETMTERSKEALACNLIFEQTREKVLSDAPWPFCRKFEALALTGTAPEHWTYSYQYPADCLAIRSILPELPSGYSTRLFRLAQWIKANRVSYELVGSNDNLTICTDEEDAVVEYTLAVTSPNRFDASFSSALSWAVAAEVALPLAKGTAVYQNAMNQYRLAIAEARTKAFNEETDDEGPDSEFVLARL